MSEQQHISRRTRIAVVVASAATLVVGAATLPAQAYRSPDAARGSGYLVRQLSAGGNHLSVTYGSSSYADTGLTIDAVLALDASGAGQQEAARATSWVGRNLGSYIGTGTEKYAGATAKALLGVKAQRGNGTTFGGVNLVSRLQGLMQPDGRYTDQSKYGDYSNIFSQSLAVVALRKAGRTVPAAAYSYLRLQQCPGGGFVQTESDTACTNNNKAETDATGIAVQALIAAPRSAWRTQAIAAAGGYLVRHQAANGGFAGSATTPTVNSNSTGLALLALRAAGRRGAAAKATGYLQGMQYGCRFAPALRGGFAYNGAARSDALKAGRKATASDQDNRATTQAALGLSGVDLIDATNRGATATAPRVTC